MNQPTSARSRMQQKWATSLSTGIEWQTERYPGTRRDVKFFADARLTATDGSTLTAHLCASRDEDGNEVVEAWVVVVTDEELAHLTDHPEAYAAIREKCHYAWVLAPMGWSPRRDELPNGWGLCVPEKVGFLYDAVKPQLLRPLTKDT